MNENALIKLSALNIGRKNKVDILLAKYNCTLYDR